jgi:tetratricopeptide (TPR) repeat protein
VIEPVAKAEPAAPSNALVPLVEAPVAEGPIEQAPDEPAPIEEAPAANTTKAAIEAPAPEPTVEPVANAQAREPNSEAPREPKAAAGDKLAAGATPPATPNQADEVNDLLKRGQRLLALGDAAGARALLEQAVAIQADNPHAHASLAQALLKLNELPLALVQAQTAVKQRPKRGHYLVVQGDVLAAMGKPDEARSSFQRAYELDPNDAVAKRKAGL